CQQTNVLTCMPVVLVLRSQYIPRGIIGRHSSFTIELTGISNNPHQLTVITPPYPVTGNCSVLACGASQQFTQRRKAIHRNCGLPGTFTPAFGQLIENSPSFSKRILAALGNQQHVHDLDSTRSDMRSAISFKVSIMKSKDSLLVKASIQFLRNCCSSSPRMADRNAWGSTQASLTRSATS